MVYRLARYCFILSLCFFSSLLKAQENGHKIQVLVKDIGILGLASHDLFSWDRKQGVSKENGRLDLSTIFANDKDGNLIGNNWYEAAYWQTGGNKKNSENAPVYTITQLIIERFKTYLQEEALEPDQARKKVVADFHQALKPSVERMLGISYPSVAKRGAVTNQEQAAYRVFHDILPAHIRLDNGNTLNITDIDSAETLLTEAELSRPIRYYDGEYDPEYNKIRVHTIRLFGFDVKDININLEQLDGDFINTYGQHFNQKDSLQELCDFANGHCEVGSISFIRHIQEMFEKAQCKYNVDGDINPWIPANIECF
ncbi:MAG TPA: hypothetical protein PKC21_07815 [Oligoflexia bacterium]|nr:hypothetical protein [Oligoflexia bacterium]HMR25244.1 hypothetical protein [Oligoflexia bacterium]